MVNTAAKARRTRRKRARFPGPVPARTFSSCKSVAMSGGRFGFGLDASAFSLSRSAVMAARDAFRGAINAAQAASSTGEGVIGGGPAAGLGGIVGGVTGGLSVGGVGVPPVAALY